MKRILLHAGAVALALMTLGSVAACNPDDVRDLALPAVKSAAVNLATAAAGGDTKSRSVLLSSLKGYCEVGEVDRLALRHALAHSGRPAVTVDCVVVAALNEQLAVDERPPIPGPAALPELASMSPPDRSASASLIALFRPDPHRRE